MHPHVDPEIRTDPWKTRPTLEELTRQDIWSFRRGFLLRLYREVTGWEVLEVGSGPAHDSLTFAERGADVTAVDSSQTALALAEGIYRRLGLPIRTVLADVRRLPCESGQFDLVFNAGVLEHFTDDELELVIDEMVRVAKPGACVLAFCPNRHNVFYQTHLRRLDKHGYQFERAFTAGEMRRRLEARGLRHVRVSGVHVHPAPNYLLPSWLPKHHRIEPTCRRCFRWLEKTNRRHRLKSVIGQDFVVWASVPARLAERRPLAPLAGGTCVRGDSETARENIA